MRTVALIFSLGLAVPATAQDVIPDTLDWRGYYPLQVGNAWEWDVWELVAVYRVERREIVGDTLIQGARYFIQKDDYWETDEEKSFFQLLQRKTTFVRYDTLATRIVSFDPELSAEVGRTCDLAAASGAEIFCDAFGSDVGVGVGGPIEIIVGNERLVFAATKGFAAHGIIFGYIHGFGEENLLGDGSAGTIDVVHLTLDGQEYGASVIDQELKVIRSTPVDGDSAVALNTTVSFDFTLPLDTTARFSRDLPVEFFAISPPDSIQIDSVYYNANLTTMYLDVRHTAGTDFVWIVTGARSESGESLRNLYSISYTTSPTRGPWTVSGVVNGFFLKTALSEEPHFATALLTAPSDSDGYPVAAATVVSDLWAQWDTPYKIEGVRNGTYWPVVLLDIDRDGRIDDWEIGRRYDPALVTSPDSLVVENSSRTGIYLGIVLGAAIDRSARPSGTEIREVYPNPAEAAVTVAFEAFAPGTASLDVVDVLGRRVVTIADGFYYPGRHTLALDTSSLSAGVYFVRLSAGDRVETTSFVVIR